MLIDSLRAFLADYFDVLQNQDMALFDRVFHADCVLYSQQDGQRTVRPFADYRKMVQGRASPASRGCPRDEHILMVDQLSPTMALAKVRLRLFDSIMEDHLNLMLHEGRWMIYAKHFYRAGSAV
ncbi:MAG: nuclear transport factor 2 family protein [Comamonadaceae bacterium]|nr:nuclear transport factor 2 family protein [Comamonadaceae bacterium]